MGKTRIGGADMDIRDIAIAKALSGGGGGGGGASAFIVNFEVSYDGGGFVVNSVDKTFAQIVDAYTNGAVIMARTFNGSENIVLYLASIIDDAEEGSATFTYIGTNNGNMSILSITSASFYIDPTGFDFSYGVHNFQ